MHVLRMTYLHWRHKKKEKEKNKNKQHFICAIQFCKVSNSGYSVFNFSSINKSFSTVSNFLVAMQIISIRNLFSSRTNKAPVFYFILFFSRHMRPLIVDDPFFDLSGTDAEKRDRIRGVIKYAISNFKNNNNKYKW